MCQNALQALNNRLNMKKIILLAAFAAITIGIAGAQDHDWARFGRYAKANSEISKAPVAVFMGDSITDNWDNADSEFFTGNNFACRGISGQTTSEMLVRFRQDVINLHPKYVVIMAGTNDIAKNNGYISEENILGNIISMCELAKANGIRPILCSITPADHYSWRPGVKPAEIIIRLNGMIKDYARKAKIKYVDYHSAMTDGNGGLPERLGPDGVHPNIEGYRIMEPMILEYIR